MEYLHNVFTQVALNFCAVENVMNRAEIGHPHNFTTAVTSSIEHFYCLILPQILDGTQ